MLEVSDVSLSSLKAGVIGMSQSGGSLWLFSMLFQAHVVLCLLCNHRNDLCASLDITVLNYYGWRSIFSKTWSVHKWIPVIIVFLNDPWFQTEQWSTSTNSCTHRTPVALPHRTLCHWVCRPEIYVNGKEYKAAFCSEELDSKKKIYLSSSFCWYSCLQNRIWGPKRFRLSQDTYKSTRDWMHWNPQRYSKEKIISWFSHTSSTLPTTLYSYPPG